MKRILAVTILLILIFTCMPSFNVSAKDTVISGEKAILRSDDAEYVIISGNRFDKDSDPGFSVSIIISDYDTKYGVFMLNGKVIASMQNGENTLYIKSSMLVEGKNELLIVPGTENGVYNESDVYGTYNLDDIIVSSVLFSETSFNKPSECNFYLPIPGDSGYTLKTVSYSDNQSIGDGWVSETHMGGNQPNMPLMVGYVFEKPSFGGYFAIDTNTIPDGTYDAEFFDASGKLSESITLIIDNTAPAVSFSIPQNSYVTRMDNIEINIDDLTSTNVILKADGKEINKLELKSLSEGQHILSVYAEDSAGNSTEEVLAFYIIEKNYFVSIDKNANKLTMSLRGDADIYSGTILKSIRMYENRTGEFNCAYLRSDDEVLLSFDNKDQLKTTAIGNSNPYQSFVINTEDVKDEEIIVSYSGNTGNGSDIQLTCWNYTTSSWDRIATLKSGETVSVAVNVKKYSSDYKMRINASPILSSNGSDTILWNSDTQYYTRYEDLNAFYTAINQYAVEEYKNGNIGYCVHTGDLVDRTNVGDDVAYTEYKFASQTQAILDKNNVPNGVVTGNHDVQHTNSNYSYFWKYFGEERYNQYDWYGGSLNNNMHHYDLVSIGMYDFVFLYVGCFRETDSDFLSWANNVCKQYPTRNVIICTHEYLLPSGKYSGNRAEVLWNELIVPNENVVMVLCGHNDGVCDQLKQVGDSDRYVLEILADYQFAELGVGPQHVENGCTCDGEGYIRLMSFTDGGQVVSTTYSPVASQYGVEPYNFFPSYQDSFIYTLDLIHPDRSITTTDFNILYKPHKLGKFGIDNISLKGCEAFYAEIINGNNKELSEVFVLEEYKIKYSVSDHKYEPTESSEPILSGGLMNVDENFRMGESNEIPDGSLVKIGLDLLPENVSSLKQTSGSSKYSLNKNPEGGFGFFHEKDTYTWITFANYLGKTVDVTENNRLYFGVTAGKNTKWNICVNFKNRVIDFSQDKTFASMFGYVNALPSDIQGTWNGYIDLTDILQGDQIINSIYLVSATPGEYVNFDYLFLGSSDAGHVRFITDENTVYAVEKAVGDTLDLPADPYKRGYTFTGWYNEAGEKHEAFLTVKSGVENIYARFEEKQLSQTQKQYFNTEIRFISLPLVKVILLIGSLLLVIVFVSVLIIKSKKKKKGDA